MRVRFLIDDPAGLWRTGEIAEDLGWECGDPALVESGEAAPVRLFNLDGQAIALTEPFNRGLVEHI